MKIPITKPVLGAEEAQAIADPLATGWLVQGPKVAAFEAAVATFVGAEHAIAMTSCTTALHAGLLARGIGPGDEVILPSFTWVATANVVELVGAKPVFVDIRRDTLNVDVDEVRANIGPRCRAIIPVSLFGLAAPSREIRELAAAKDIFVMEDAACGLGAFAGDRHTGVDAHCAAFSFHPRKCITTGEGGMLVTNDAALAHRVRAIRDHGASTSDLARHLGPRPYVMPEFPLVGSNFRMTDFQGALGMCQMKRLEWILSERRRRAHRYDELLRDVGALRTPFVPPGARHAYQSYVTWFTPEEPTLANVEALHERRNAIMDRLERDGVATRPGTHAVHLLAFYSERYGLRREDATNAYLADRLTLTLPLYPQMTDEEQDHVIAALRRAVKGS